MTYGDGLSNVNIRQTLNFHYQKKKKISNSYNNKP